MKTPALLVVACVLAGGCVRDALLCSLDPSVDEFPGASTPEIPHDSALAAEIADGYQLYGVPLARSGQWMVDPVYSVRWCPKLAAPLAFFPYVSNGHWTPIESVPSSHAPFSVDSPYWVTDHETAWSEITMHHGWWVNESHPGALAPWCWIPGTIETPARVLWRESDGFVGWAPEPPRAGPDAGDDDDLLAWVFEFTGTLFEDAVDTVLFRGDAASTADAVTRDARERQRQQGLGPMRSGPTPAEVRAARTALSQYAAAHPTAETDAAADHGPEGSIPPRSSSRVGGEHQAPTLGERALPPVHTLYRQMVHDPDIEVAPRGHLSLPVIPHAELRASSASASTSESGGGGWRASHGSSQGSTSSWSGHGASHNSYAGHAGSSGGDCGSHSSRHR